MNMTPRQRVLTAMRRQVPDRVPRWIDYASFAPELMRTFVKQTGANTPAEYFDYELRVVSFKAATQRSDLGRYIPDSLPEGAVIDWNWGNVLLKGRHENISQIWHHALAEAESVDEIMAYPMPDFLDESRWQHLSYATAQYHQREYAVMGAMSQTLFESAWGVRGFEAFLIDCMINTELAVALLDRLTQIRIGQASIYANAGVYILRLGDDVGTERGMMISSELFCQLLKPRLKLVIDQAKKIKEDILIFYHSDGDCREIIPDLIEIGVDILNPVQPETMDPAEIKRQYGSQLAFIGTISTQVTMPFGTPEQVADEVKLRIDTVGRGGGLLLGPTHLLQDEVPWCNVMAFFDAVERYGKY
jgi:uroporphyrinogen decarboxylase